MPSNLPSAWTIKLLETPEEMEALEGLQRLAWPGSETDVIPVHMLMAVAHNGGLALGAFDDGKLIGAVFGFPGYYRTPDGPRLKHHSHILAVHPDRQDRGIGYALKRAQWQMVRYQGIDRITWTYDPMLSRNAHLNISRLGAVCNTYLRSEYGEMRDGNNAGLPSDRFQVDWWVYTRRVESKLSRRSRTALTLEHYLTAESLLIDAQTGKNGLVQPPNTQPELGGSLLLVEIPQDFLKIKEMDLALARDWRFFGREIFEKAFKEGYLVTDFIHTQERSFYVLTHGESTF